MAANDFINLLVYRGDDLSMALNFKNLEDDPIDITGWIISFTVKDKTFRDDSYAKILIDVDTHLDPEYGRTAIQVSHVLTDPLVGIYQYDLQYRTPENIVRTFARGQIRFLDDVSRR